MLGLGTTELLVVLFIILLLFGGRKLPELARSLGSAAREFTKASEAPPDKEEPKEKKEEDEKEIILNAAKKIGINVEGKSVKEIAEELVEASEKKE
jgi:sec-independent protein translocase protein TatA